MPPTIENGIVNAIKRSRTAGFSMDVVDGDWACEFSGKREQKVYLITLNLVG